MPAGQDERPDKRQRILAAATSVFADKGYAGAAIADIAIRADVGKGTVYEYYASKEDLFFAVFEWFILQGATAIKVDIAVLGLTVSERLIALSESIVRQWENLQHEFALMMEFWAASSSSQSRDRFRQAFRNFYGHYRGIVSALLQEGMARGEYRQDIEPEFIAAGLVGAWDALFLQAWFDDSFDLHPVADEFIKVIIKGLLAPTE